MIRMRARLNDLVTNHAMMIAAYREKTMSRIYLRYICDIGDNTISRNKRQQQYRGIRRSLELTRRCRRDKALIKRRSS